MKNDTFEKLTSVTMVTIRIILKRKEDGTFLAFYWLVQQAAGLASTKAYWTMLEFPFFSFTLGIFAFN